MNELPPNKLLELTVDPQAGLLPQTTPAPQRQLNAVLGG